MKKLISIFIIFVTLTAGSGSCRADSFYRFSMPAEVASFAGNSITSEQYKDSLIDIVAKPELSANVSVTFVRSTVIEINLRKNRIKISAADLKRKRDEVIRLAGGIERLKQGLIQTRMHWYSINAMVRDALGLEIMARGLHKVPAGQEVSPELLSKTLKKMMEGYKNPEFLGCRKPCVLTVGNVDILQSDFRNFLLLNCDRKFLRAVLTGLIADRRILAEAAELQIMPNTLDVQKL
ncbi:MAG: hypothetical protein ACYTFY_21710, partial [Planctomycetota bacterium]